MLGTTAASTDNKKIWDREERALSILLLISAGG